MTLRNSAVLAVVWAMLAGVGSSFAEAADDLAAGPFPYFAYVVGPDVHLRSGPGMQYYPTERLAEGVEVEVYRCDPGGWLAVRPTDQSFSWVLARYVRAASANQGIIVGDGVVARTGSRLSDVRDVIQVQLNEGERVAILGVREFGEGRARESWVQIAPPAGEFRWISARDVRKAPTQLAQAPAKPKRSPAPPRPQPERVAAAETDAIDEVGYEEEAAAPAKRETAPALAATSASSSGWKTSTTPAPRKKPREAVVQADFDESDAEPIAPPRPAPARKGKSFDEALAEDVAPQRRLQRDTVSDEGERLASLQADVGREAAREPDEWNFDDLYTELQELSEHGRQSYVRKRASELCEQIERFESIRERRRELREEAPDVVAAKYDPPAKPSASRNSGVRRASYEEPADEPVRAVKPARYDDAPEYESEAPVEAPPMLPASARTPPRRTSTPTPEPPTESAEDPRFDAVGVLTPVIATKVGDPTYALLDERGEVSAFVAPAPGVSLRRCVGERIGVVGSTSTLTAHGSKTLVVVRRAASIGK